MNVATFESNGPADLGLIEPEPASIAIEEESDAYAKIIAEPLAPGFGITIGNALRRVLLGSLPGAAVTSIRIEEVMHEFSTIPGVKEDSMDLTAQ